MIKYVLFTSIFYFWVNSLPGQNLKPILQEVEKNNKFLQAQSRFWDAKKVEYQTGLTPANPRVDLEYLFGSPAIQGDQTDFVVSQPWELPVTYRQKKNVSRKQTGLAELYFSKYRQDVLWEVTSTCIELVYLNKLLSELTSQKKSIKFWQENFDKKLNAGEGNIMDVHKAKLKILEINTTIAETENHQTNMSQKLAELNGGLPLDFSDTLYYLHETIPDFDTLWLETRSLDPMQKILAQEISIGQSKIELSKVMNYPKFESGYHYQAILGQQFHGVHFGLTIPLWENKNKVKQQQSEYAFHEANLVAHGLQLYTGLKNDYDTWKTFSTMVKDYQSILTSSNHIPLLDKSLRLGHISTLDYFLELSLYSESKKKYLEAEKTYHLLAARLMKYRLVNL